MIRSAGEGRRNSAASAFQSLMAWDWTGLLLGIIVSAVGAILSRSSHFVGFALVLLGLCLVSGATRYLLHRFGIRRRFPPPGKLVDIGGYRIHLLAQGDGPSVVWIGGAHSGGYVMQHLHDLAAIEFRSILIDRPGTGWSDTGPFPRSTARESDELTAALLAANEGGPFIFAGHSFGGLLAANIARRNPEVTAGVLLLDATPPDTIVYGPRLSSLRAMRSTALKIAAKRFFGIGLKPSPPPDHPVLRQYAKVLGQHQLAGNAVETSVGNALASWSIYRELAPRGLADVAWETVVYDGDLDDIPVRIVFPDDSARSDHNEIGLLPEYVLASETEQRRMRNFFARNRLRYLASSTRSSYLSAPSGSGHNFPYFHPEIVIAALRATANEAELARAT